MMGKTPRGSRVAKRMIGNYPLCPNVDPSIGPASLFLFLHFFASHLACEVGLVL